MFARPIMMIHFCDSWWSKIRSATSIQRNFVTKKRCALGYLVTFSRHQLWKIPCKCDVSLNWHTTDATTWWYEWLYMTSWCPVTHIDTSLNTSEPPWYNGWPPAGMAPPGHQDSILGQSGLKSNPNAEACSHSHLCSRYFILSTDQGLFVWLGWGVSYLGYNARPGLSLSCLPTVIP